MRFNQPGLFPILPLISSFMVSILKTTLIVAVLGLAIAGCGGGGNNTPPHPGDKYLIVPGTRVGEIAFQNTYDDLVKTFGKDSIVDDSICADPECGEQVIATYIHKGSDNEQIVFWADSMFHQQINFIQLDQPNSPFYTKDGVGIKTGLTKIETLNGKPFQFLGFGWDNGGQIVDMDQGKIDSLLSLTFDYNLPDGVDMDTSILGDRTLSSDMPTVQKNKAQIYVSRILIFPKGN